MLSDCAKLSPNELKALPAKAPVVAVERADVKRLANLPSPPSASAVAPDNKLSPICTAKIVPSISRLAFVTSFPDLLRSSKILLVEPTVELGNNVL